MKIRWVLPLFLLAAHSFAVVLPPSDDATTKVGIRVAAPRAGTIQVGSNARGWVQFNLNQLPDGTTGSQVARAILRLYPSVLARDTAFTVSTAKSAWTEGAIIDSTAPALNAPEIIGVPLVKDARGSFVALDVTSIVRDWINTPSTNHGFALTAETGAPLVGFDSKENAVAGHYPQLDITLASTGIAGPKGDKGDKGDTGAVGPQGIAGPQGLIGPQGLVGAAGPRGLQGVPGSQGVQGLTGPKGDKGDRGTTGDQGPAGAEPFYGTASAGDFNAGGDSTNPETFLLQYIGNDTHVGFDYQFQNFTVASGRILHIPRGCRIRCTGNFTNSGTLIVDGDFDLTSKKLQALLLAGPDILTAVSGGAVGGGSQGGDGHDNGGEDLGNGSGGLSIRAKGTLINTGSIIAKGGNGFSEGGNRATGIGGGGGGTIILCAGTEVKNTGTLDVTGGSGGDFTNSYHGDPTVIALGGGGGGGGLLLFVSKSVIRTGAELISPGANGASLATITISDGKEVRSYGRGGTGGGGVGGAGGSFGGYFGFDETGPGTFGPFEVHLPQAGEIFQQIGDPSGIFSP